MQLLFLTTLLCLLLVLLVHGIVLLKLVRKLSLLERSEPFTYERKGSVGIVTDLGQASPKPDMGRVDGLTQDDVEWARELGATTEQEVLDLVRKHEESLR